MTYRDDLFQLRTITGTGSYETVESFAIVDPHSPHIVADSWTGLGNKERHESVRIWLNQKQWAELAEFAAKMAQDANVIEHMGSPDARHLTDAEVRAEVALKRAHYFENQKDLVILGLQNLTDAGMVWSRLSILREATQDVLQALMDEGLVDSREAKFGKGTRIEYSLTFKGQKKAKTLQ